MGIKRQVLKGAWREGRRAGSAAWGWLKEQPPVKQRVERAERIIEERKRHLEARLRRLEAELYEWVRSLEDAHGYAPPRVRGPSLQESYARLDVPYGAPFEEARRAWRKRLRACHPDRFPHDEAARARAEVEAREVNEAFQVIKRALSA